MLEQEYESTRGGDLVVAIALAAKAVAEDLEGNADLRGELLVRHRCPATFPPYRPGHVRDARDGREDRILIPEDLLEDTNVEPD